MRKVINTSIFLLVLTSLGAFGFYSIKINHKLSTDMKITVSEGEGFYAVLRKVREQDSGVSFRVARLYLKFKGLEKSLKLGDYSFSKGDSLKSLISDFSKGNVVKYKVIIPEGYNLFEIANLLEETGIVPIKENFLKIVRSSAQAKKYLGYEARSLEGYLYPATYEFSKRTKAALVVRALVEANKNNLDVLLEKVEMPKGFTRHQLVTLASVVEKETGAAHERPMIASVFLNRLKKGMRLQSDPTTIYGQWLKTGERLFNIRKRHLLEKNEHNTYAIRALPAGPISNPGYEALKAVCEPVKTKYLYFVSKNDGTHYFSKTYKEHATAVRRFQMSRKARAGKSWRDLDKKKK